jgi:hypothetical protein
MAHTTQLHFPSQPGPHQYSFPPFDKANLMGRMEPFTFATNVERHQPTPATQTAGILQVYQVLGLNLMPSTAGHLVFLPSDVHAAHDIQPPAYYLVLFSHIPFMYCMPSDPLPFLLSNPESSMSPRSNKHRRMSADSASEPPSSAISFSGVTVHFALSSHREVSMSNPSPYIRTLYI